MKKVKIFKADDGYGDEYSSSVLREGITDWEEISDEDYKFLKDNFHSIYRDTGFGGNLVLITQDDVPVVKRIESIKRLIDAKKAAIDKEKREKEAEALKRAMKKKAKTEEQERKLLVELQAKYEATANADKRK